MLQNKRSIMASAVLLALSIGSAQAANEIYIGKVTSNDINTLTITQAGSGAVNKVGITSGSSQFNIDGKWNSVAISQTSTGLASNYAGQNVNGAPGDTDYNPARDAITGAGNTITGSVKNASSGTTNTMSLTQSGNGNAIALAVGATTASTGTTVIGISQTGLQNQSTYTMNHTGNITASETTAGDQNVVSVTSSGGTNYSNTISLTGNENKVTVARSGAFTTSTDNISLVGNLNTVNLTGTAIGTNSVTLGAIGNSNTFGINQTGAGSTASFNVATNYKNINLTQATAGSIFSLTGTLTNGGFITVNQ